MFTSHQRSNKTRENEKRRHKAGIEGGGTEREDTRMQTDMGREWKRTSLLGGQRSAGNQEQHCTKTDIFRRILVSILVRIKHIFGTVSNPDYWCEYSPYSAVFPVGL